MDMPQSGWRGQVHSVRRPYYEPCSVHLHFPAHFDCMHVTNLTSVIPQCCYRSFKPTTSNSEQVNSPGATQRTFCPRTRRDFIRSVRSIQFTPNNLRASRPVYRAQHFQKICSQIYSRPKNKKKKNICFATQIVPVPIYHPSESHRFNAHENT